MHKFPPSPNTVTAFRLIAPMAVVVILHLPALWQTVRGETLTSDEDSGLIVLDFCAVFLWYGLLRRVVHQQTRIDRQAERIQSLQVINEMLRATAPTRSLPVVPQRNRVERRVTQAR